MWILRNYSRFIRPGAIRVGVSAYDQKGDPISEGDTDAFSLMTSAYVNKDDSSVAVVVNYSEREREFSLEWKENTSNQFIPYITNEEKDANLKPLKMIRLNHKTAIPTRFVITYVSN